MICNCNGLMVCGHCHLEECDCELMYYECTECHHKKCNWCGNSTHILRNSQDSYCEECCDWDYVGDVCESDFCTHYLGGQGHININLICNECQSKSPMIRVPLAFPLLLETLLSDYPKFETIQKQFLKYYAYAHTSGIWEPNPASEFKLAQEYFNFDAGIIVLGRSRDDETKAKNNDALKREKSLRKILKKERRMNRLEDKKVNQILSL